VAAQPPQRRPLSLALLDIDAFKQYNDFYGHPAGDRALRAVARSAAAGLRRPADLAARYGGEEMVLLLPDTEAAQAQQVVSAICCAIADLQIPHEASSVAPMLTVSAGGATLDCVAPESSAELFTAADNLLYKAKKSGRNRWSGASTSSGGRGAPAWRTSAPRRSAWR
jgi:diguanylate cyclase (GGDEF)-like protein